MGTRCDHCGTYLKLREYDSETFTFCEECKEEKIVNKDAKEIRLYGNKYSVTNNNGTLTTKRNGIPWPEMDKELIGSGFTLALVQRIEELEEAIEFLKENKA